MDVNTIGEVTIIKVKKKSVTFCSRHASLSIGDFLLQVHVYFKHNVLLELLFTCHFRINNYVFMKYFLLVSAYVDLLAVLDYKPAPL